MASLSFLKALVCSRMRSSRRSAVTSPRGSSMIIAPIALPPSPMVAGGPAAALDSLGVRSDTGTTARSIRPLTASPRDATTLERPCAQAVRMMSLKVPPCRERKRLMRPSSTSSMPHRRPASTGPLMAVGLIGVPGCSSGLRSISSVGAAGAVWPENAEPSKAAASRPASVAAAASNVASEGSGAGCQLSRHRWGPARLRAEQQPDDLGRETPSTMAWCIRHHDDPPAVRQAGRTDAAARAGIVRSMTPDMTSRHRCPGVDVGGVDRGGVQVHVSVHIEAHVIDPDRQRRCNGRWRSR